jgi:RNA polymerase sigma factor for flagellar operon FliA
MEGTQPDPFASQLPAIEDAIGVVVRRRRVRREECQDFAATAMVRLLEDDRAILRKFEGRSSLRTYLVAAIDRMLLDYRIAQWGKWRASAEARRLGPVALSLERLVSCDCLSFAEAAETLRVNHRVNASERELQSLLEKLPVRTRRRFITEKALDRLPQDAPGPELTLLHSHAARTLKALKTAVLTLPDAERRLIAMRFIERRSVAEIARALGVEQKALYRMFDRVMARLRAELERQGIAGPDVRGWLGAIDVNLVHQAA